MTSWIYAVANVGTEAQAKISAEKEAEISPLEQPPRRFGRPAISGQTVEMKRQKPID